MCVGVPPSCNIVTNTDVIGPDPKRACLTFNELVTEVDDFEQTPCCRSESSVEDEIELYTVVPKLKVDADPVL